MEKPGKCPYCLVPLPASDHIVELITVAGWMSVIIGCPKHPRTNTITAIVDKSKE